MNFRTALSTFLTALVALALVMGAVVVFGEWVGR